MTCQADSSACWTRSRFITETLSSCIHCVRDKTRFHFFRKSVQSLKSPISYSRVVFVTWQHEQEAVRLLLLVSHRGFLSLSRAIALITLVNKVFTRLVVTCRFHIHVKVRTKFTDGSKASRGGNWCIFAVFMLKATCER